MTGVRQCGKTYIIKEFGENEFEDSAYKYNPQSAIRTSVSNYRKEIERYKKQNAHTEERIIIFICKRGML